MFLAVQLESRLIYCLNKACLTASTSVISHRTILTGSRPLGWGWRRGEQSVQPPPSLSPCVFGAVVVVVVAESTAGALLSLTLNGEGLRNSEHQDRYIWSVYPLKCTCATKWRTPGAHWINSSNQPMSTLLCCIMRSFKKRMCVLIFNIEKNLIDLSQHILIVTKYKKMLLFLTSFFPSFYVLCE